MTYSPIIVVTIAANELQITPAKSTPVPVDGIGDSGTEVCGFAEGLVMGSNAGINSPPAAKGW